MDFKRQNQLKKSYESQLVRAWDRARSENDGLRKVRPVIRDLQHYKHLHPS